MKVGLILEAGGSLKSLEATGQLERFVTHYLYPYQKAFGEVLIFSYAKEGEEITPSSLPKGVRLLLCPGNFRPRLYSLLMPFLYRSEIKRCDFLRIFQMDACPPAILSKFLYRVPYVATYGYRYEDTYKVEKRPLAARILKVILRLGARWAESVFVTWEGLWEEVTRLNRMTYFQPNGVDLRLFREQEKIPHAGKTIFYVGGLVRRKNVELLIRAAALLENISLHIVGEGPLRGELERLASNRNVHAIFYGSMPHARLPELLRQADLFVIPSVFEGHVKVLSEAMACGLPCVGTDVEGIRDLIQHEKTGLLCDSTPEALAAGIRRLLEDPLFAAQLGKQGKRFVEKRFDLERLVQGEIEWIKKILNRPRSGEWKEIRRIPASFQHRPLKLCYVNEYFHPFSLGGGEISMFFHAKSLAKAGHQVTVITPNYGAPSWEIIDGVEIFRFPFPKKLSKGQECNSVYFMIPLFWLLVAFQVVKVSLKKRFDVIHAQNSFSAIGCFLAAKCLRIPFMATLRDYMTVCSVGAFCLQQKDLPPHRCGFLQNERCTFQFQKRYASNQTLFQKLKVFVRTLWAVVEVKVKRWAIRRADRIVVVSQAVGRIYQETGFPSHKMIWLPNPPPPSIYLTAENPVQTDHSPNGKKTVLFVGKLSVGKGADVLLDAIPEILKQLPETLFLFAGRLTRAVKVPEAVQPHIQLLGHLTQEEVHQVYRRCDVVVVPSVWPEPYPRVALEAIAHHKPVVASRVGGIPEIVQDGVHGRLVERHNTGALAEAVVDVLSGKTQFAVQTQEVPLLLGTEEIVQRLDRFYREVVTEYREQTGRRN